MGIFEELVLAEKRIHELLKNFRGATPGLTRDEAAVIEIGQDAWIVPKDVAAELAALRVDAASYKRYAEQAREELAQLREAVRKAEALAARLDEVANHPSYASLFVHAHAHGKAYHGPSWDKPLEEFRHAAAAIRAGRGG